MKKCPISLLAALPIVAFAQAPVEYAISFAGAAHHEARVSVTWREIGDRPLEMRMSRSSPGRYALHEFAKNVYDFSAVDGQGRPLAVSRRDPYQWDVTGHDGTVVATYTLYADRIDGTYAAIDLTHAHLNMPASFLWARGFDQRPIRIRFEPLAGWKIATQLAPTADPSTFSAPNLQYFMDSPTELSDFSERSWQVGSNGETQTMRLIVHHAGSEENVDRILERTRKVVDVESRVFGELPRFDYGEYRFIVDYLPYAQGDGMEHRNSTIISDPEPLDFSDFGEQLDSYAHEFFHVWNVERMRPAELEPFDLERANVTPSLWFAEGFTSYYAPLAIHRAGESTLTRYIEELTDLVERISSAPGRRFGSPQEMSSQAALFDGAVSLDPNNAANSFFSYYSYGAAIALALDLTLRSRFEDVTLDSFMAEMWRLHGEPERPYAADDLRSVLGRVTRNPEFAEDFFARFVSGRELPDYAYLLANAGLLLRRANPGAASLGEVSLDFDGDGAEITSNTLIGTALYAAGLDRGDRITSIGQHRIRSPRDWNRLLERYEPGQTLTVRFVQRGFERSAELTFGEDQRLEVVSFESAGRELDDTQTAFRSRWLDSPR